jgi:hypothetical protein
MRIPTTITNAVAWVVFSAAGPGNAQSATEHLFRVYDTAGNRQVSFHFTFKNARRNTVWLEYDAG